MKSFVYGKYFRDPETKDTEPNTLYVFSPDTAPVYGSGMPVVIHFHGGGFIGGEATNQSSAEIESYLNNGVVYVSVEYRLVGKTFYYKDSAGSIKEEEFINVDEDGKLSLDSRMLLSEYEVVTGWQELMTKCVFDGKTALDYLLGHKDELRLDTQRIGFSGDSAGTSICFYLSLIYPQFPEAASYTAVSVTLGNAQLNYPFLPLLDAGWKLWSDDLGEDALLSTICTKEGCPELLGQGGKWCPKPDVCNLTWSEEAGQRFCGDSFATTTLGDMVSWYTWPTDSEFNRGLTKLWYTASNLADLERSDAEGPLFVYVANVANSRDLDGITHAAFWSRAYASVLEEKASKDVRFLTRYEDFPGMGEADVGTSNFGTTHYRSNFEYYRSNLPTHDASVQSEMFHMICDAMSLSCKA